MNISAVENSLHGNSWLRFGLLKTKFVFGEVKFGIFIGGT